MQTLDYPIRVPSDVLEALGENTARMQYHPRVLQTYRAAATAMRGRPSGSAYLAVTNGCSPMSAGQRGKRR
jgi:hypothetical protein